ERAYHLESSARPGELGLCFLGRTAPATRPFLSRSAGISFLYTRLAFPPIGRNYVYLGCHHPRTQQAAPPPLVLGGLESIPPRRYFRALRSQLRSLRWPHCHPRSAGVR